MDGEYKEKDIRIRYAQAVQKVGKETERIKFMKSNPIKAICIYHRGAYDNLRDSYNIVLKYIEDNGYEIIDNPRECYIDGCWNKEIENDYEQVIKKLSAQQKKELAKFSMLAKVLSVKQLCKKIVDDFSIYQINDASGEFEKANENIDLMIGALPETDAFDFVLNYDNFSLEVENECGGDNVSVMTIHKSKGIEFKYVFLINTTNEFNFESTYESVVFNKYFGVGIDFYDTIERTQIPTIASSGVKLLEKRKLVEEQQRVLYVALTRAKEKLFVICSKEQEKIAQKNKAHKKCYADWFEPIIYNELYGKHNPLINFVKFRSSELSEKSNGKTRAVYFKDQDEKEPEWFVYQHLDANNFRLKTSISKILKETQSENEKFVGTGSSADRGTDYHKFLQKIDLKKDKNKNAKYVRSKEPPRQDWR